MNKIILLLAIFLLLGASCSITSSKETQDSNVKQGLDFIDSHKQNQKTFLLQQCLNDCGGKYCQTVNGRSTCQNLSAVATCEADCETKYMN